MKFLVVRMCGPNQMHVKPALQVTIKVGRCLPQGLLPRIPGMTMAGIPLDLSIRLRANMWTIMKGIFLRLSVRECQEMMEICTATS